MLATEPDVEVIAECGSGTEALGAIKERKPDVVLLDVQMPDGDGLEVAAQVGDMALPSIIFVTAFDEYALRAFDAAAVDYLLKPVRRARLRTALARARRVVASRPGGHPAGPAGAIVGTEAPAGRGARLLVDRGRHMEVASVDDIDWVEASDNHVIVHLRSERHRYRRTMEQVMDRLPADRFVRVHRSAIVNLDRVKQVHPWFHGTWLLVLADGAKIATGRHYREALAARLNLFR